MNFLTYLNKHFDCVTHSFFDSSITGTNNTGKDVDEIWLYEKGNDCEPLLILRDNWWYSEGTVKGEYCVLNIYSTLPNGTIIQESELRSLIKEGKVKSKYN